MDLDTVDVRDQCSLQCDSMRIRYIFLLVFPLIALWSNYAHSQTDSTSAEFLFKNGLLTFQNGDDVTARKAFSDVLKVDSQNPFALYNLGIIDSRQGRKGLALARWRRALLIRPNFSQAGEAIKWQNEKLPRKDIPHDVELWESFRTAVLITSPINYFLIGSAVFLFLSGWRLLGFFGLRRRAQLEENPAPPIPLFAATCAMLFVAMSFLSAAKLYDNSTARGTVIATKIEARSAPDPKATPLFDLYEGLEVLIGGTSESWTQVKYPGGATGWIPSNSLVVTTEMAAP